MRTVEYHDDELIDERAAATVVGMSVAWLQRDRWAGPTIPFIKMGRAVRYRVGDLRAAIRERTVTAA